MAVQILSPEVPTLRAVRRKEFAANEFPSLSPNSRNLKVVPRLGRNEGLGSRARIRARTKDAELRISLECNQNVRLYGQFPAPVKKSEEEEEEEQDYYLNMGYAIRTLREGFPELFYRELNFDIYRDDIVFKDPLNTFMGIENYKSIFWGLRFHGRIFFRALWVDIISVWQPVENVLMVRWTVHGIPRVPWESRGRFDGTSQYKFDKKGKIFEHRVDNIATNTPHKFKVLTVGELIQSLGCPSTPKPTYFESSSSSSSRRN
ncbi:uncharacterized protein LOC104443394 [Eucalyptus grandis]|uniref:Uncharacterized protein n=2 Tax=Eucalyptus grandis TaxID=71139 RepID=A0ACC3KRC9_EUCGR|nr:uncharacterized protein LOC104443394 [Eucalyptus grandis]KAK3428582.1 hypothetical protein EUGRSUZ_E00085 [Eucalyptus grandis]